MGQPEAVLDYKAVDNPPSDEVEDNKSETGSAPEREQWTSKAEFILSVIGFSIGLGNVWRFPYLCYKNGGGAFFIPYFVCLIFGGAPVFFMEALLGQYMARGGIGAWRVAPLFMGIGLATAIVVFLLNSFYIVVLAWDLSYMAHSFTSVLPWSHCNNSWNTPRCSEFAGKLNCSEVVVSTGLSNNTLTQCVNWTETALDNSTNLTRVDPVVEFWEKKILQISPGIDQPDGIVWELAVALIVAWVLCYFCVWRGVNWTGKVVYFTATFPYVMLTVLLVRGVTLDGALDGIIFYLKPDFTRLSDSQVWLDAGTQIFFSYSIANGCLLALSSYNKFHNDCYKDCILLTCINGCTSVYSGFAIFSVLGFMAKEQGVSISDVAESGPGLAFIAYPKAVTLMPLAPLWAFLFFVMILLLGLDSQFVQMEGFITIMTDMFPGLRKGNRRPLAIFCYCLVSFLIGLTMITRGGMYVFQLFDYYSASGMVLLWICFFECIAVAWVYGGRRFYDNIEMMLRYRINPMLRICWTYITPFVTAAIFIFMWSQFTPLTYNRVYEYPGWANALGMCLGFVSMVAIPIFALAKLASVPGSLRHRWTVMTTPVLVPERVVDHWVDADYLRKIGRQGHRVDDRNMLFCPGNPAVGTEEELPFNGLYEKSIEPV